MSLASGGYYVKVAQIEEQLEALDVSAGNVLQKIEDLSGSVIDFDEGGNYDNVGSNRGYFIAPTNGYYSFKGKIRLPTGSNARSFVAFYIDRGSGRVEYESFYADLSVSSATTIARGQTSSCIAKLNAGDKMTLGLDATASTISSPVVDIIFAGYKINDF